MCCLLFQWVGLITDSVRFVTKNIVSDNDDEESGERAKKEIRREEEVSLSQLKIS